jgi:polysaccharide export outer membrane protein
MVDKMMRKEHSRNLIQMGGRMTRTMNSRFLLPLALGLVFAVGAPRALTAQNPGSTADGGLQPGDVVQVTVWERPELSGEFTVAPDGSLNHPLYRQVRVTGIPVGQVEERVRSFLSQYEANPQMVVQPLYQVAISGPVMRPDIYNLPPGTTIAQAVTQAGGITETGKRDDVMLIRDARETELDLTEAEAIQMPIQSGDQILVKTKGSAGAFVRVVVPLIHAVSVVANIVNIVTR